jgi:hypothetical protein
LNFLITTQTTFSRVFKLQGLRAKEGLVFLSLDALVMYNPTMFRYSYFH